MLNNLMFGFALDSNFYQIKSNFTGKNNHIAPPKERSTESSLNTKEKEISYYRINDLYKKTSSNYSIFI